MQSQPSPSPFKVVAAVDFSIQSPGVLRRALAIANQAQKSEVHAVAVTDSYPGGESTPDASAQLLDLVNTAVKEWSDRGLTLGVERVVTHVLAGNPAKEVVWLAAYVNADLAVVGTHGRQGVRHLVLGSVAEKVLRTCGCPVLVERPKHHNEAWTIPEIEPPCPDCLAARKASNGAQMWCARHLEHHARAHTYSWSGGDIGDARPWGFTE
jgi:nucleotide-binding universal stress UspA family protein